MFVGSDSGGRGTHRGQGDNGRGSVAERGIGKWLEKNTVRSSFFASATCRGNLGRFITLRSVHEQDGTIEYLDEALRYLFPKGEVCEGPTRLKICGRNSKTICNRDISLCRMQVDLNLR